MRVLVSLDALMQALEVSVQVSDISVQISSVVAAVLALSAAAFALFAACFLLSVSIFLVRVMVPFRLLICFITFLVSHAQVGLRVVGLEVGLEGLVFFTAVWSDLTIFWRLANSRQSSDEGVEGGGGGVRKGWRL